MEGETKFDVLYKIKVYEITLRELLIIKSLYASKNLADITTLVKKMPDPVLFFKVFLELEMKSVLHFISFDR